MNRWLGFRLMWRFPACDMVDKNPWRQDFFYGLLIRQLMIGLWVSWERPDVFKPATPPPAPPEGQG